MGKVSFFLPGGDYIELHLLYWKTKKYRCLQSSSLSHSVHCENIRLHTVCTPQRPSKILDGQCCFIHLTVLSSHHQMITCLVLLKVLWVHHYLNDEAL
jgi:hypothetical protein